MKKKILISGPILSRSGYGEMARFAFRSLKSREDLFDIYIMQTQWGNTGNLFEVTEEKLEIDSIIKETQRYIQISNNQPNFDISIQVTIPNEWKKLAAINIGYTAGIETNAVSAAWFTPSNTMDKIVVISNHAKDGFVNPVFSDDKGNKYKITTPIEVCHFPVRDHKEAKLDLDLKHDFNFLTVCQWSPRKNLEQTIINFIEEFKKEDVGLVLKINTSNDSLLDQEFTEERLTNILASFPDRKCSVYLLHGHMSEAEMQALYKHPKIKALVSSTHGEGFGFPLFEASYNELPVIATDWSGHLDFLTMKDEEGVEKKMFAKVDYQLNLIAKEHVWPGVLEAETAWAYPTPSSFKNKMREVYKDYPRFKSWAKKLNKWIRQEFTKEKIYDNFIFSIVDKEEATRLDSLKGSMIDLYSLQDEVTVVNE
jgi:glycosyltransferase involved in cell wall biosynthesis